MIERVIRRRHVSSGVRDRIAGGALALGAANFPLRSGRRLGPRSRPSWHAKSAGPGMVGVPIERFATAQVCLMSGLVVLVPWGWSTQLAVVNVAVAALFLAAPVGVAREDVAYAILALLTGATTTTFGALFLERYRYDAFLRTALQRDEAAIAAALLHVGETLDTHLHQPDMIERVNACGEDARLHWTAVLCDDARSVPLSERARGRRSGPVLSQPTPRHSSAIAALRPGADLASGHLPDPRRSPEPRADRVLSHGSRRSRAARDHRRLGARVRDSTGPFAHRSAGRRGIAHATAVRSIRPPDRRLRQEPLKSSSGPTIARAPRREVITCYADLWPRDVRGLTPSIRHPPPHSPELVRASLSGERHPELGRLEAGRETRTGAVDLGPVCGARRRLDALVRPELRSLAGRSSVETWPATARSETLLKTLVGNAQVHARGVVEVRAAATTSRVTLAIRDTASSSPPPTSGHLRDVPSGGRLVPASFGGVGSLPS